MNGGPFHAHTQFVLSKVQVAEKESPSAVIETLLRCQGARVAPSLSKQAAEALSKQAAEALNRANCAIGPHKENLIKQAIIADTKTLQTACCLFSSAQKALHALEKRLDQSQSRWFDRCLFVFSVSSSLKPPVCLLCRSTSKLLHSHIVSQGLLVMTSQKWFVGNSNIQRDASKMYQLLCCSGCDTGIFSDYGESLGIPFIKEVSKRLKQGGSNFAVAIDEKTEGCPSPLFILLLAHAFRWMATRSCELEVDGLVRDAPSSNPTDLAECFWTFFEDLSAILLPLKPSKSKNPTTPFDHNFAGGRVMCFLVSSKQLWDCKCTSTRVMSHNIAGLYYVSMTFCGIKFLVVR